MTEAERRERENEIHQQENLQRLRGFRPIDDTFMRALMRDNMSLAEFVLRIIIKKPDLKLISFKTQDDMKQVTGARSVCLDVTGTDAEGKKYDIEVQKAGSGAEPHRARYHSSVMDIEYLNAGQSFDELPDTYTIFITEEDFYEVGASIYPIQRMNMVTGKPFCDGEHILYVNGEYRGDDELGKLMHDFNCSDPDDMNYKILADRARYFKENPKGVSEMCKAMDDLRIESERRGEMKGFVEACQDFGKSIADAAVMIARKFGLSEETSHSIVAQYWKA